MSGWVGVDLDGTLAEYDGWRGVSHIGKPIPAMLERVKRWLLSGVEVRILTARVSLNMIELWDDRVVAVEHNTGRVLGGRSRV